ncbi:MAG: radical SAM protein, partial [Actinomycetia bacterium]|nr:radical SAM protein [Actinomycetes bacterium]
MSARSSEVHRVGFITLGCPKNEADTARMRTLLHGSNFVVVDEVELADIAIINTCGFITSATEESLECIFDTVRDWLPARRGRHIVVVGCLASRYGTELSDELSEVSLCLGVNDERDIVAHLERLVAGQDGRDETPEVVGDTGPHDERTKSSLSVENRRKARGPSEYVMIADGCDRACSYCTIPSIRGPYASRPISAIVEEVESLIASGAREIVLVAQDTTQYGKDLAEDASLVKLIDTLCALPDPFWLRVMYMQPEG